MNAATLGTYLAKRAAGLPPALPRPPAMRALPPAPHLPTTVPHLSTTQLPAPHTQVMPTPWMTFLPGKQTTGLGHPAHLPPNPSVRLPETSPSAGGNFHGWDEALARAAPGHFEPGQPSMGPIDWSKMAPEHFGNLGQRALGWMRRNPGKTQAGALGGLGLAAGAGTAAAALGGQAAEQSPQAAPAPKAVPTSPPVESSSDWENPDMAHQRGPWSPSLRRLPLGMGGLGGLGPVASANRILADYEGARNVGTAAGAGLQASQATAGIPGPLSLLALRHAQLPTEGAAPGQATPAARALNMLGGVPSVL